MRKLYWYITAYIRKHGIKFILAVATGILIFSVVVPTLVKNLSQKQRYYVGIVGEYNLNNLPLVIKKQLSQGLMTTQADGTFTPDLAEKLIIENGGLRYRFVLPENLFWQDGKEFQPTDINYQLKDTQVTIEGQQIIFDLPAVFASFPQVLTPQLLRIEREKVWNLFEREKVIGLGEARLTSFKYNDQSKRSLSQVVVDNLKTKQRFVYRFYFTQDQAVEAFQLGQVDYLIDVTNLNQIKDWETTAVNERLLADQYLAVFFNNSDPIMTKNLRQALSYSVEKESPGMTRTLGPITESSWAFFKGTKRYDKNLDSAVDRLLDEMPGEPIEIELTTTNNYFDVASRIKEDWEQLGAKAAETCLNDKEFKDKDACEYLRIKVKVQIQSFPDTNNFQTLLIGQQVSADPDQYNLWHSGLATNFTKYKNTKVDNLLEKGRQTVDQKERLTIYQEFQQVLLEDPPAIFLWYLKSADLARK